MDKMEVLQTSRYRMYGIGTVASDLIVGNKNIKVYVHEILANYSGDINKKDHVTKVVKDSDGGAHSVDIDEHRQLEEVIWAPSDTNRVTPPNVRKGEKVIVWQYGDFNKFYWTKLGLELDLRRLEHVTHVYVNTDDEEENPINSDNSYWTTISTLNKFVRLHTSDNDGEHTTYDITIDTKTGKLEVEDGKGNYIHMISFMDTINVNALKDINLTSKNEINLTTNVINMKANEINMEAGSINMTGSGKIAMSSANILADTPTFTVTGTMAAKAVTSSGAITASGRVTGSNIS